MTIFESAAVLFMGLVGLAVVLCLADICVILSDCVSERLNNTDD